MEPTLRKLWKDEEAPTATEYGFMLLLIMVVIVLTVTALGQRVDVMFNEVLTALGG